MEKVKMDHPVVVPLSGPKNQNATRLFNDPNFAAAVLAQHRAAQADGITDSIIVMSERRPGLVESAYGPREEFIAGAPDWFRESPAGKDLAAAPASGKYWVVYVSQEEMFCIQFSNIYMGNTVGAT